MNMNSQDDLTKSANTQQKSPVSDGPISLRKSKNGVSTNGGIDLKSGVVYVNDEEITNTGPRSNVMINTNSSSDVEVEQSELSPVASGNDKMVMIQKEIANLYLKIKRCSKDISLTESQYIKHVETSEDRKEKAMINKLDPLVVLQYINVSIDVIINLKFEDIETKMLDKVNTPKKKAMNELNELRKSMLDGLEVPSAKEYAIQETPKEIRDFMNQNGKNDLNSERSAASSKLGGVSQQSCPKIYEEIIQKLEADIRKHIRIEHQLKLHIESTEDRIEELEREQKPQEEDGKLIKEMEKVKTETDALKKRIKSFEMKEKQTKSEYEEKIKKQISEISKYQTQIQENKEKVFQLQALNKKLTESIQSLSEQLKRKDLSIVADGPREMKLSVGPGSPEKKKGQSQRSNHFSSDTQTKKNNVNTALKLSKIYSSNAHTPGMVNIPGNMSQKAAMHSQSVQQFPVGKSPIKEIKVPKKEIKLNYQFKNQNPTSNNTRNSQSLIYTSIPNNNSQQAINQYSRDQLSKMYQTQQGFLPVQKGAQMQYILKNNNNSLDRSMPKIVQEEQWAINDKRAQTQIVSQNNLLQSVGSPGDSTGGTKFVGKNSSNGFNQTQIAIKLYEQRNRSCQSQLGQNDIMLASSQRKGSRNQPMPKNTKLNTTHQVINNNTQFKGPQKIPMLQKIPGSQNQGMILAKGSYIQRNSNTGIQISKVSAPPLNRKQSLKK